MPATAPATGPATVAHGPVASRRGASLAAVIADSTRGATEQASNQRWLVLCESSCLHPTPQSESIGRRTLTHPHSAHHLAIMSGSGVRQFPNTSPHAAHPLTPPAGARGRLPHAPVAGADEEQAQGRPDRPRPAEAQERGPDQVRFHCYIHRLRCSTTLHTLDSLHPLTTPTPPGASAKSPVASMRPSARWAASCRSPPSPSPRSPTPSAATLATRSRSPPSRPASACAPSRRTSRVSSCPSSRASPPTPPTTLHSRAWARVDSRFSAHGRRMRGRSRRWWSWPVCRLRL